MTSLTDFERPLVLQSISLTLSSLATNNPSWWLIDSIISEWLAKMAMMEAQNWSCNILSGPANIALIEKRSHGPAHVNVWRSRVVWYAKLGSMEVPTLTAKVCTKYMLYSAITMEEIWLYVCWSAKKTCANSQFFSITNEVYNQLKYPEICTKNILNIKFYCQVQS